MDNKCKKCSKELTGRQTSYCSPRCSKLHLKALYKKRRKDHVHEYNRKYRSLGISPLSTEKKKKIIMTHGGECLRCKTTKRLNVHHIKPLRFGGTHKTIIVLCFPCHMEIEQRMRGYWE